jgi:hypothetical protein
MLMSANHGRVEHQRFEIGRSKGMNDLLPHSRFRPAAEPLKHRVRKPEAFGEISPGSARSCDPDHHIDEQPIVLCMAAWIANLAWKQVLDLSPFVVREFVASHGEASLPVNSCGSSPALDNRTRPNQAR